jgi:DNA-binding transcriptional ArsR family regulator
MIAAETQVDFSAAPPAPTLEWELGSAYDLFISLVVLHDPEMFGLRPSWAAGVRSRLPAAERKFLEDLFAWFKAPLEWVHSLPEPRDASRALGELARLPAAQRLSALTFGGGFPAEAAALLEAVAARSAWSAADEDALRAALEAAPVPRSEPLKHRQLAGMLSAWVAAAENGERLLAALRAYVEVFFAEEEQRLLPALHSGLRRARSLAERLPLAELVDELSQGVRFEDLSREPRLALAPSYWGAPFVFYSRLPGQGRILLFGARPAEASLVPGEDVPDGVLRALKALADPTRLRILQYLNRQPQTPAQLARRLRLRPPTVIHHLAALRLAGMVYLSLAASGERRYAARLESIAALIQGLDGFLNTAAGSPPVEE